MIRPALDKGEWVVGDRHDLSSRAYQGGGRGIADELINPIRRAVLGDFKPDLTLYLDIPPEIGLERARGRGELDRTELEHIDFFERTRDKYIHIAKTEANIEIVDALQSIDQVASNITAILDQTYPNV